MSKQSAGILLYRRKENRIEFLLVHPGGPLYAKKDAGVWSIPKGEFEEEEPLEAAKREFHEETGIPISGMGIPLKPQKQKSGKTIYAWAFEGELDPKLVKSNSFEMEWPPKSGKKQSFPEIDRAQWFDLETVAVKIHPGQEPFIRELLDNLNLPSEPIQPNLF